MFYSDKISKLPMHFKVLEVGPGGYPHPRSNVLLEKNFSTEDLATAQRGYAPMHQSKQVTIYYDGGRFPFADNEFDYIICSHVIEHIPKEDLAYFIDEMQRVARRGFIEFPTVFYELINFHELHKWFMNYRGGIMFFLDKQFFHSNYLHKIIRDMFYGQDKYAAQIFTRYRELFFHAFEWNEEIKFEIVDSIDKLIIEDDYIFFSEYFKKFKPCSTPERLYNFLASLCKRIKNKLLKLTINITKV